MKHINDVRHVLRDLLYNKFFLHMSTNSYNNIKKLCERCGDIKFWTNNDKGS